MVNDTFAFLFSQGLGHDKPCLYGVGVRVISKIKEDVAEFAMNQSQTVSILGRVGSKTVRYRICCFCLYLNGTSYEVDIL